MATLSEEIHAGITAGQLALWRAEHWSRQMLADQLMQAEAEIARLIAEIAAMRTATLPLLAEIAAAVKGTDHRVREARGEKIRRDA